MPTIRKLAMLLLACLLLAACGNEKQSDVAIWDQTNWDQASWQ